MQSQFTRGSTDATAIPLQGIEQCAAFGFCQGGRAWLMDVRQGAIQRKVGEIDGGAICAHTGLQENVS